MKTKYVPHQKRRQGSVLVVSMTIFAVGAVLLASYLTLVQTQTNSIARSQTWNSAIGLTEAGLEEGMAMINAGSPSVDSNNVTTKPWNFTNNLGANNWPAITNNGTSITRIVSSNGAGNSGYTVWIDTSGTAPTVTAAGFVSYTQERWGSDPWKPLTSLSLSQPFLAAVGTSQSPNTGNSTTVLGRRVQVATVLAPLFSVAVLTRSNFNMHGNGTTIDSFDSSSTTYSTLGQYDASKRKANGSLATDSAVINDLSIGNGNIYGHVYTGPGSSSSVVSVGNNGAVGDLAWQAGGNSGIEPGFWSGNFNTAIPDVPAPTWGGLTLPSPTNNQIVLTATSSTPSYYTTTAAGAPTKPLVISGGNVIMWVQGAFTPPQLIFTNGGSLTLYIGTTSGSGDTLSLSGNSNMNSPGLSANLLILGLPSLTSISLSGNGAFCACIYAPEANVTGNGGGNNTIDTSGSLVVNSVTLNGHWNFHYDESLQNSGASRGWIAKNWSELKY